MMPECNCQIETPTVRQSLGLDINEDAANIREVRKVFDTKIGTCYGDMLTITGKEGNETVVYMEQC